MSKHRAPCPTCGGDCAAEYCRAEHRRISHTGLWKWTAPTDDEPIRSHP